MTTQRMTRTEPGPTQAQAEQTTLVQKKNPSVHLNVVEKVILIEKRQQQVVAIVVVDVAVVWLTVMMCIMLIM